MRPVPATLLSVAVVLVAVVGAVGAVGASAPVTAGGDPIQAQAATNTPGDTPADVTPADADAIVENGSTYYTGQLLYDSRAQPNETVQVREVLDRRGGEIVETERRATTVADGDGEFLVDTAGLADGEYVLRGNESGRRGTFELATQRFTAFAFENDTVDENGSATLAVGSNRERYALDVRVERNGTAVDPETVADGLEPSVDALDVEAVDLPTDADDEPDVVRVAGEWNGTGPADGRLTFDFAALPAGTYEVSGQVTDSTANGSATVEKADDAGDGGNGSDTPAQPPRIGDAENRPLDPDGDGAYEDVDGDGTVTVEDARLLYDNFQEDPVWSNQAAFDFDGDGDLDDEDLAALLEEA